MKSVDKRSVVAVDDDAGNLRLLSQMLSELGFAVRPSISGRLALESIRIDPPDAILLDITMPEMSGYDVCREVLKTPSLQNIPIIFLSGREGIEDKVEAFEAGGRDYISKPFNIEEVSARLNIHIALEEAKKAEIRRSGFLESLVRDRLVVEKQRDDLVHMLVHDLRGQMQGAFTAIEYFASRFADQFNDDDRKMHAVATNCSEAISRIISPILEYGKLSAGELNLQAVEQDIYSLCLRARDSVPFSDRIAVTECNHSALFDAGLIHRVLVNLLDNAFKYGSDEGPIDIEITSESGGIVVQVVDHGPGIPNTERENIFRHFYRSSKDVDSHENSVGLGLAFCRLAIESHGGTIWVTDTPGGGATVAFRIPTLKDASATSNHESG